MAIVYGANYGRPTLDLNFAKNKSLIDTLTGRNLITFSRSSTGTYVGADGLIKTAIANEPRFDHNPTTGESLGLLVEEARTNLRTASTVFTTGWTWSENVTVASGQTSPTGDSTASLVTAAAGTLRARLGENFVSSGSVVYTRSWFVKKTNQRYIWCGDQNNGNYSPNYRFDLDLGTGTVVSGSGFNSGFSITPFPNGYYRISVSCISGDIWTIVASNSSSLNPLTNTYAHDGTETFVIWGYQVEQGSFPTSYIPTTSATVTRAADVASMTGTNFSSWYRQDEGTVIASVKNMPVTSTVYIVDIGTNATGGSGASGHAIYATSTIAGGFTQVSNVTVADVSSTYSVNTVNAAYAYKVNNFSFALNNVLGTPDTSGAIPVLGAQQVVIGARFNGTQALNNPIARLAYYPVRLADAQLQALTR